MNDTEHATIKCPQCGTKNRVPRQRLNDNPICGRCRARLPRTPVFDRPVVVTDATFESEILGCPGPVLLDCWAPWCGPCKMIAPMLDQIAAEKAGKVKIAKLNVDQNPATASRFSIMSIPTLLLFNSGRLVNTLVGVQSKAAIEQQLRRL